MHSEVSEKLKAYIDKELSFFERRVIARHLKICPDCASKTKAFEIITKTIKDLKETQAPADFTQKGMAKIESVKPLRFPPGSLSASYEIISSSLSLPRFFATFVALLFPIFFGLMVGDIGYGLLIVAIAWGVKRKFKGNLFVHNIGAIFTLCGLSTIVFGALFGEFFGELANWGIKYHLHFHLSDKIMFHFPVHRAEANIIKSMLILAVGIGVGHIFLGLVLGMVNALREKSRKHLLEKSGVFLALFASVLMLVGVAKILPSGFGSIGVVAFIIGVVLLMYGAGFIGIIEIVSGIGNILSYFRLTPLGIASVISLMARGGG